ncbi:unnamed protein product [Triticum aestivum]|uniref:Aminotransferase-like plant mobile domain-containing protein n=1 Tax=Triticum aestivum TaxID=4565 RepID=A0A7H4LR13_WHEAT|nr:unnamed protein product [Triticum aestivum]
MEALIGMSPPEAPVEDGEKKERVATKAPFTWIVVNFAHCPEDATNDVTQTYARVYMWYVISRTLFVDATVNDTCCRISKDGCIGGCMPVLSVWSWECLPVGHPKDITYKAWDDKGDELRLPTWAYKWDVVSEMTSDVTLMYRQYTNELDTITTERVEWEPYGTKDKLGNAGDFIMNLMCLRDRHLWLMRCPLICNWAVELHMPHRVYRQFSLFQSHPSEWQDMDKPLHRLDRKKQRKIKDWDRYHKKYVTMFELSVEQAQVTTRSQLREHRPLAFNNHLKWYLASTRVEICKPAFAEEILEDPTVFDELTQHEYNKYVREGTRVSSAPVNFVIKKLADESQTILQTTPIGKSNGEGALPAFIKTHVGPPSAEFCRTVTNFPQVDDLRFINPWET